MRLQNKCVIVTGAGSGIGRALAIEFARNGANVVCCGRRAEKLQETAALIQQQGGTALAAQADITQRQQVRRMVDLAVERFGAIDVLFNNAGSFNAIGGVHEVQPDLWWQDVTVNLLGSYLCIREVLPVMIRQNSGIIINMGGGRPVGGSAYAAGKAGLMELSRILTEEIKLQKLNILVFTAGPGLVRTEMTELQAHCDAGRKWIPSTWEHFQSGKLRMPEEIARATIRLIEVACPEINGMSYGPDTIFEPQSDVGAGSRACPP